MIFFFCLQRKADECLDFRSFSICKNYENVNSKLEAMITILANCIDMERKLPGSIVYSRTIGVGRMILSLVDFPIHL
jgi:hypothetical protein